MIRSFAVAALLCAVATSLPAFAQAEPAPQPPAGAPAGGPDDAARPAAHSISGTVQSLNYGPNGMAEGLILTVDGKLVQVNLPRPAESFATLVAPGDQIKASVTEDTGPQGGPAGRGPGAAGGPGGRRARGPAARGGPGQEAPAQAGAGQEADAPPPPAGGPAGDMTPDHAVYLLVSLTDAKGQEHRVPSAEDRKTAHVEGTVKSLNYDRRGMTNGALLDTGDLVRVGPREAKQLDLAVGKKLSVDGMALPVTGGHQMIDAETVNGASVRPAGGPPGRQGPGARGPRGNGGPAGGPDGQDTPPNAAGGNPR